MKVGVRGWALPFNDWKALSVNPAVNGYFLNLGRIRQKNERDGLHFSFAVTSVQRTSNLHCLFSS